MNELNEWIQRPKNSHATERDNKINNVNISSLTFSKYRKNEYTQGINSLPLLSLLRQAVTTVSAQEIIQMVQGFGGDQSFWVVCAG